jgi:hypothetical protein
MESCLGAGLSAEKDSKGATSVISDKLDNILSTLLCIERRLAVIESQKKAPPKEGITPPPIKELGQISIGKTGLPNLAFGQVCVLCSCASH